MICADFLAGANQEHDDPGVLLQSALRFFQFLSGDEQKTFLKALSSGRHELDPTEAASPAARFRVVRTTPQRGTTTGWLETPILCSDVQS